MRRPVTWVTIVSVCQLIKSRAIRPINKLFEKPICGERKNITIQVQMMPSRLLINNFTIIPIILNLLYFERV